MNAHRQARSENDGLVSSYIFKLQAQEYTLSRWVRAVTPARIKIDGKPNIE
jgi:hypothetical protein